MVPSERFLAELLSEGCAVVLGKIVRVLLAATSIAPLTVSLTYVYAAKEHQYLYAALSALSCVTLGLIAFWVISRAQQKLETLRISIKKAKSADKEVIGFFIAYALPLVFRPPSSLDLGAWVVAAGMLLFVLWNTHTMNVNPVLGMFGFHFYEVETGDGITYLLITRRRINNVLSIADVVQLSEYGILEKA